MWVWGANYDDESQGNTVIQLPLTVFIQTEPKPLD